MRRDDDSDPRHRGRPTSHRCLPPATARSPAGAVPPLQAVHTVAHGLIVQEKHIIATAEALGALQPLLDRLAAAQPAAGADSSQHPAASQPGVLQPGGADQEAVGQEAQQKQH